MFLKTYRENHAACMARFNEVQHLYGLVDAAPVVSKIETPTLETIPKVETIVHIEPATADRIRELEAQIAAQAKQIEKLTEKCETAEKDYYGLYDDHVELKRVRDELEIELEHYQNKTKDALNVLIDMARALKKQLSVDDKSYDELFDAASTIVDN